MANDKNAQKFLSTFPPEIQAMIRDFSRLRIEHQALIQKHNATFAQYKSLHAAMIVLLKRAPERTITMQREDFEGILFDEYNISLYENPLTKDLVFKLIHKSETPGVEFEMPASEGDAIH